MKEARYYKKLDDDKVQCTACEWKCVLEPGRSGTCGVRANKSGKLESLVYGNVVDAYGDYIEKKKVAHMLPGSTAFSIGTIGCNFSCDFCINWQISQASKRIKEKLRREGKAADFQTEISQYGYDLSPDKIVEYCQRKNYKIIAYTYNEPTVFVEYALDTAQLARKAGIKNVFVTNGYFSEEVFPDLIEHMDVMSVDLKSFRDTFYRKHCKASVDPVLRNIRDISKASVWMELTTLIIPGENDSDRELTKIAEYIAGLSPDIPWHITAFSPDYKMLDKPRTSDERLYSAYEIAKEAGLNYVYFGNLWDSDKTSTYCPGCGKKLIHRDAYDIEVMDIFENGSCTNCGENIPGIWSQQFKHTGKNDAGTH